MRLLASVLASGTRPCDRDNTQTYWTGCVVMYVSVAQDYKWRDLDENPIIFDTLFLVHNRLVVFQSTSLIFWSINRSRNNFCCHLLAWQDQGCCVNWNQFWVLRVAFFSLHLLFCFVLVGIELTLLLVTSPQTCIMHCILVLKGKMSDSITIFLSIAQPRVCFANSLVCLGFVVLIPYIFCFQWIPFMLARYCFCQVM